MIIKDKVKSYIHRYGLSFVMSYIATPVAALAVRALTGNNILAAFAGVWADNLFFYGIIIYRDLAARQQLNFKECLKVARNLMVEFSAPEYLDSFILRPFYLSIFPYLIPDHYAIAILIGVLCADISYFIPTIILYETRKKLFKD